MTERIVTIWRRGRARVEVTDRGLVVHWETRHYVFPSIWEALTPPTVIRSREDLAELPDHRALRLVALAAWAEHVTRRAALLRRTA